MAHGINAIGSDMADLGLNCNAQTPGLCPTSELPRNRSLPAWACPQKCMSFKTRAEFGFDLRKGRPFELPPSASDPNLPIPDWASFHRKIRARDSDTNTGRLRTNKPENGPEKCMSLKTHAQVGFDLQRCRELERP